MLTFTPWKKRQIKTWSTKRHERNLNSAMKTRMLITCWSMECIRGKGYPLIVRALRVNVSLSRFKVVLLFFITQRLHIIRRDYFVKAKLIKKDGDSLIPLNNAILETGCRLCYRIRDNVAQTKPEKHKYMAEHVKKKASVDYRIFFLSMSGPTLSPVSSLCFKCDLSQTGN